MTDKQFDKMCKDAGKDWSADNDHDGGEQTLDQVAYDMADSMLYDPKVKEYVKYNLGSEYSKERACEFIADRIV